MDKIKIDPELKKAVQYALWLMREKDTPPPLANWKAGEKYGFTASEVAKGTGKVAGTVAGWKNKRRR